MRKILIISLLLLAIKSFSQAAGAVVVKSAPTLEGLSAENLENSLHQLEESAKQTTELAKTSDIADKTFKMLKEVNQHIITGRSTVKILEEIAQAGVSINRLYGTIREKEKNGKSKVSIKAFLDTAYYFSQEIEGKSLELHDALKDGVLNMTDSERILYLRQIQEDVELLRFKAENFIFYINE